jgi:hypothetical protein
MITEGEAIKSKRCPVDKQPCIGSRCMAWQWLPKEHLRRTELWSKSKGIKVNSAFGDDAEWRPIAADEGLPLPEPIGRCSMTLMGQK